MKTCVLLVVLLAYLEQRLCGAAVTLLRADSAVWSDTVCAVYNEDWGHVPTSDHPTVQYRAEVASDMLACAPQTTPLVGGAIISLRGNCSFCEKAYYAESANASLLVVVYNDSDLSVEPVCDDDSTPSIPVLLVTNESGWDILNTITLTNLTLAPFTPHSVPFDPAAMVTLLIAVITVVLGSYIANSPFEFMRYGLLLRKGESYGMKEEGEGKGGRKVVVMTLVAVLVFLILICLVLLMLYYFYYPMVYIVIAVYCVGASIGLYHLLSPFAALIPLTKDIRLPVNKLPLLEFRPDPRFPVTVLLCVAVTVWWLVERHSVYGWVLQDLLGFAFLTHILSRMLFLPTWVVSVAMVFLFFYDIIMVFITPFLTEDHQSVMVKAATGGGGAEGGGRTTELLPIVFIVPKILPSALDRTCSDITGFFQYSLLGYGDAGVPGLLVALCLKFDITHRPASKCRLYFCVSSLAYCAGLGLTYLALFLMKTAQPALLYLVPTTLISVVILALSRREFCLFFTGKPQAGHRATGRRKGRCGHVQVDTVVIETDTEGDEGEEEILIDN